MKKNILLFIAILFLICNSILNAQTKVQGTINDSQGNAIPFSNILVKKDSLSSIISYAYSDAKGKYNISIKESGEYTLVFSSLGYTSQNKIIYLDEDTNEINIAVVLKDESTSLDEVIVLAERPIRVQNDTITFKSKYFTDGTEQTVEDLLRRIPGLQIDSEGTIKVGNQEIEKLMVDGDDLFERGYKLLSKNMPAYPIEEVEVLKNYSNNRLLKGVEDSDKVALNLKLDEKSKRIWFGNIEAGHGNDGFYELKTNLMNFGKKNKYYFLTNFNSIGYDATGDINQLIRPMRYNEPASIGDNQQVRDLISLAPPQLNFKRRRTNFNNAELVSLNAIFNPTEKLKIKTLGFFNADETDFFQTNIQNVTLNDVNFTNTEDFQLKNRKLIGFGKLDFVYDFSKTEMLESTTKYNSGNFDDDSNLLFNGISTRQDLSHTNTLFDQKLSYSNKFKDKKVFLLTGRFIDETTPQTYRLNQFFYEDLFPDQSADNVRQLSDNKMQYIGVNAHLLDRKANDDLFEVQVGNELRKDRLQTSLELLEDDVVSNRPDGYQNQTSYTVNDLYLKSKYRYSINDFAIIGEANVHQLFNKLELENSSDNESPFFVNPRLSLDWKISDKNRIRSSYSHTTTNAKILDVYSDFVLTGFRPFTRGTGEFNQLDASSLTFNYELGNWSSRFFANTFVLYSKNHDFFSTNTFIDQNFTQSSKILIQDREFISINSKLDYYFKFISSNLKLDLSYSQSEFKNIVNDSELRQVESTTIGYGLELRSGFTGWFNYHLGTKWTSNEIQTTIQNSFTDNVSFLDLSFILNERFNIQVESERYEFGNINLDNVYYFADLEAQYKLKKDKWTLGLSGKNLFNTRQFRNFNISDIGSTTTTYRLLPRYVLLKVLYRF
ncbi:carboxypeptidase-like regulatory domain-containing protein [Psychroflexus montanilacus]|uniref:carboxypeptidase-like regulatory domain-containing protein n=1 Tax=Psychroflexus montanilacus TaxID=2873598 RepID=UPI001CCC0524|nr:carboxypeptidase-like regulatory domain-containing protein [Psychroflexus montanilacus]MBZ9652430.1 carboxypeptidase-like regulatory domain-containing protein [Psychroflexus montanilacus]